MHNNTEQMPVRFSANFPTKQTAKLPNCPLNIRHLVAVRVTLKTALQVQILQCAGTDNNTRRDPTISDST